MIEPRDVVRIALQKCVRDEKIDNLERNDTRLCQRRRLTIQKTSQFIHFLKHLFICSISLVGIQTDSDLG